jgi:hypothetical protein
MTRYATATRTVWSNAPASPQRLLLFGLASSILFKLGLADCECGYSAPTGTDTQELAVFTDLIESNFSTIPDISQDSDWVRQAFNFTPAQARGPVGEMFVVDNVASSDAGLQLKVQAQAVDGMVPVAEIDTSRLDVFWGTFRASMKLTNVSGTCAAFFWVSK